MEEFMSIENRATSISWLQVRITCCCSGSITTTWNQTNLFLSRVKFSSFLNPESRNKPNAKGRFQNVKKGKCGNFSYVGKPPTSPHSMVIFAWFVCLFWAILWQSHLMADVFSQKQSPKGWLVQLCHSLWCYYGDHQPLPLLSNTFPLFSLLNDGLKCKLFIWAYFKICQANDCIQLQFTIMMNPESLKFSSFFFYASV